MLDISIQFSGNRSDKIRPIYKLNSISPNCTNILKKPKTVLAEFELLTEIGWDLSQHFRGIFIEDQKKTKSTHLLAKAIDNCISILKLIPSSKHSSSQQNYIDLSAIFSLCRNLIELSNIEWYLIQDDISEDELNLRIKIFIYHDFVSTKEVFDQILFDDETSEYLKEKITEYKTLLEGNGEFKKLENSLQKLIIKGKKSLVLTQFEIAKNRNIDFDEFKAYYQLLSLYTHSTPSSITHLVISQTEDDLKDFDSLILSLNLFYAASFLAMMIKSVGELWNMGFAKPKSKKIVEEYCVRIRNSR